MRGGCVSIGAPRESGRVETPFGSEAWTTFLSEELAVPVHVAFGAARKNVLIARPEGEGYRLRMHRGFASAPPEVRTAVVRWLRSGRRAPRAAETLDRWIDEVLVPSFAPRRAPKATVRGDHHDLAELAAELLPTHLGTDLLAVERYPTLTWGRRQRSGARRSLQLGSYDAIQHLVRMHPVLDQPAVPRFFVRYVLFHELLHAALPSKRDRARTVHHGPAFRRLEQAYPDYDSAKAWEDLHIRRLIRSARTGKPLKPQATGAVGLVQRLLFD